MRLGWELDGRFKIARTCPMMQANVHAPTASRAASELVAADVRVCTQLGLAEWAEWPCARLSASRGLAGESTAAIEGQAPRGPELSGHEEVVCFVRFDGGLLLCLRVVV